MILVFNKTDLLDDDQRRYQQMMVQLYETIGYQCLQVSAATGDGFDGLPALLQGKITLLSGNSGWESRRSSTALCRAPTCAPPS